MRGDRHVQEIAPVHHHAAVAASAGCGGRGWRL